MGTATLPVRGPLVSYLSTTTWSRPPLCAAIASSRRTTWSRAQPIPRFGSVQEDIEWRVPHATSSVSMARASAAATAGGAAELFARAGSAAAREETRRRGSEKTRSRAMRGSFREVDPDARILQDRFVGTGLALVR